MSLEAENEALRKQVAALEKENVYLAYLAQKALRLSEMFKKDFKWNPKNFWNMSLEQFREIIEILERVEWHVQDKEK